MAGSIKYPSGALTSCTLKVYKLTEPSALISPIGMSLLSTYPFLSVIRIVAVFLSTFVSLNAAPASGLSGFSASAFVITSRPLILLSTISISMTWLLSTDSNLISSALT